MSDYLEFLRWREDRLNPRQAQAEEVPLKQIAAAATYTPGKSKGMKRDFSFFPEVPLTVEQSAKPAETVVSDAACSYFTLNEGAKIEMESVAGAKQSRAPQ